jgi:MFS family permease
MANTSIGQDAFEESKPVLGIPLAEPTEAKSIGFLIMFCLASGVIGLGSFTIMTVLLPAQVTALHPANSATYFGLIASCGALLTFLSIPLVGAWSDRTTSRFGRRRLWIIGGGVLLTIGLVLLAEAGNIPMLIVGVLLAETAVGVIQAALAAIIPEQIPLQQRALGSALVGIAPLMVGFVGQILVVQVHNQTVSYICLAAISLVLLLSFTFFVLHDPVIRDVPPPFKLKNMVTSFWVSPRRYPNFGYTWLSRFFVFFSYTTLTNFVFFYLRDAVHYSQLFPGSTLSQGQQIFFLIFTPVIIVSSILCGILSDRVQRRKVFVIGSCILIAIGLFTLTVLPTWSGVLIGDAILSIGVGGYLSSDLALASLVLPTIRDSGKDLGILNTAIFLPLVIAPIVASIILGVTQSYIILFGMLTVAAILAMQSTLPIKGIR